MSKKVVTLSIIFILVISGFVYFGINEMSREDIVENTVKVNPESNNIKVIPEPYKVTSSGEIIKPKTAPVADTVPIVTDYSTTIQDLLNSPIVQDLPKSAILNLKFYNFNTGERTWEKSYILKKNSVEEGNVKGDMEIVVSSKYVKNLKDQTTCEVLTLANNNNDFGVYTELSDSALAWKFKGMLKYKSCLGL